MKTCLFGIIVSYKDHLFICPMLYLYILMSVSSLLVFNTCPVACFTVVMRDKK